MGLLELVFVVSKWRPYLLGGPLRLYPTNIGFEVPFGVESMDY